MVTFFGPVTQTRTLVSQDPREVTTPAARMLFRHYGPQAEGVNVYIIGGVVSTDEPSNDQWVSGTVRVLFGAHCEPVTAAEVAVLTAAGYGANIHDSEYWDSYDDVYRDFEGC